MKIRSFYSFPFGANGDVPVSGDFDADGKDDAAVFRPSTQLGIFMQVRKERSFKVSAQAATFRKSAIMTATANPIWQFSVRRSVNGG